MRNTLFYSVFKSFLQIMNDFIPHGTGIQENWQVVTTISHHQLRAWYRYIFMPLIYAYFSWWWPILVITKFEISNHPIWQALYLKFFLTFQSQLEMLELYYFKAIFTTKQPIFHPLTWANIFKKSNLCNLFSLLFKSRNLSTYLN